MRALLLGLALTALAAAAPAQDADDWSERLVAAALERTTHFVSYDGAYRALDYPGGDVPDSLGVCTDVVIRSYRAALGVDLQQRVHEDMAAHFEAYPALWGLNGPDANIDHRRVPNLQRFLERHGGAAAPGAEYRAGDLVTWMLPGNLPHIGIVTDRLSADGERPLVVHNIGRGPRLEDFLFGAPITGHYRWDGR